MKRHLKKPRLLISIALLAFAVINIFAIPDFRTDSAHFRIRYVVDVPLIDTSYIDNAQRIDSMKQLLTDIKEDRNLKIKSVKFRGTASPEGPYERNLWLSENRLRTFTELVNEIIEVPDSIIYSNTKDIPWNEFRDAVASSNISHREEVLDIIDEDAVLVPFWGGRHIDRRLVKLRTLHGGAVWEELLNPILRDLRYGDALFEIERYYVAADPAGPTLTSICSPVFPLAVDVPQMIVEEWMPRWYLKTNFAAWVLFSANLAVEVDLGRHWSFTLPIYYCGMDWIKSTIKFRNFTIQPEIRWWPRSSQNEGFFLGAHFMMCYYNIALNGEWRYQDYRGKTPALGGGIALGYRMPISQNQRWHLEFSLGAGIYPLDYSLFHNTPNYKDGQWHARNKKTYIGFDQVGITLAYSFDMPRFKRVKTNKGITL